eukprot:TRINITY_DN10456_c0_g3_i1.p1 TRINITY_DN10456_c0_g3~~TRINITY_DN10456_c0_g3_i1.p1  ORF type:complete len:136 (+),score=23.07 TRINITY_DN10456_c0_g3_i1:415-822(+)
MFNSLETQGSCNCQMFEHMGILCRHVLNVFRVENVFLLPSHYILKRWARNAKEVLLDESSNKEQGICRESIILRYNDPCQRSIKIAGGAKSIESYKAAVHALHWTFEDVTSLNDSLTKFSELSSQISLSNHQSSQ